MHLYNNQQHTMQTATKAADLIAAGAIGQSAIWEVNTGMDQREQEMTG